VRLDVNDPSTYAVLEGARVLVDVSSSAGTNPRRLIDHCLATGVTYLSASSDRALVSSLLEQYASTSDTRGRVVLGAGIFTGLSNLLARDAIRRTGACTSLDLGISTNPFSGAGKGTVDLMADALATDTAVYRDGARVIGPSVARGPILSFPEKPRSTLLVPFPETEMLFASTGVPNIRTFMAPRPAMLRTAFLMLPAFLTRARWFRGFMRGYFSFLRRVVLRSRATRVQLVAVADGERGRAVTRLSTEDGMATGGLAIAAMARHLAMEPAQHSTGERTLKCVDEVMSLDDAVASMHAIATPNERVSIDRVS
jgi:short subunit dehydrogenase-like uncharacterized protein